MVHRAIDSPGEALVLPARRRSSPRSRAGPRRCRPSPGSRARSRRARGRGRSAGSRPARAASFTASISEPETARQRSQSSVTEVSLPGADVEHAALVAERTERRAGDVADVDVVARLAAVAEDPRLLASQSGAEEDRDDARLAVRVLARPVDVSVAERDVVQAVQPVERPQVLLARELRGAVRRERLERPRLLLPASGTRRRSRRPSS